MLQNEKYKITDIKFLLYSTVIITLLSIFIESASATTFSFSRRNRRGFVPDATAIGTITTNDTLGVLEVDDITDWEITLRYPLNRGQGPLPAVTLTPDNSTLGFTPNTVFASEDQLTIALGNLARNTFFAINANNSRAKYSFLNIFANCRFRQDILVANGGGISSNLSRSSRSFSSPAIADSTPSEPVPEPLTIVGTGTAIAFGTAFKRKLNKAKKK